MYRSVSSMAEYTAASGNVLWYNWAAAIVTYKADIGLPVIPAAPTVTSPTSPVIVDLSSQQIAGTAEAGALVKVWADANNNGVHDGGDTLAGSQQLGSSATSYSISATLAQDTINHFIVTATNAQGNESAATAVPAITEDSTGPIGDDLVPRCRTLQRRGLDGDHYGHGQRQSLGCPACAG